MADISKEAVERLAERLKRNYREPVEELRENDEATAADTLRAQAARIEELEAALAGTRSLVCEAAAVGFNHTDGDWAERLFSNNGTISLALMTRQRCRRSLPSTCSRTTRRPALRALRCGRKRRLTDG